MAIYRGASDTVGASGAQTTTFLQAINYVLERLREDTVATYDETSYSELVGHFVNQAKREVEDAWNWSRLRTTVQVTTADGTYRYALTGAGDRFRIMQDPHTGEYDVLNITNDYALRMAPSSQFMTTRQVLGATQNGDPLYFDINGYDASGDPYVNLWPIPNSIATINFQLVVPQPDLTAGDTKIVVPSHPVLLKAYALAINERGEDQGTISNKEDEIARLALADAISRDAGYTQNELTFIVQ